MIFLGNRVYFALLLLFSPCLSCLFLSGLISVLAVRALDVRPGAPATIVGVTEVRQNNPLKDPGEGRKCFLQTQRDDRGCQRILFGTVYRKQCTHCLRPFAVLITSECSSPRAHVNEPTAFPLSWAKQLQHRAAPAYTDTRSRLHRFGIQL